MGRQPKAHPHRDDAAAKTAAAPLLPAWLAPNPDGGCTLAVHAKPGAKHCSIALGEEVLDVAIDAPSRDGEANAGIVEFLAEALGLKPRDLAVVAGGKSREKLVKVHGLVGAEVLRRLQESNKRRRVGPAKQAAAEAGADAAAAEAAAEPAGVEEEEDDGLGELKELGLPVAFGSGKTSLPRPRAQAQVYGAEWHGEQASSPCELDAAIMATPPQQGQQQQQEQGGEGGGAPSGGQPDWQQAYDAATGHYYYYCQASNQTQWEPPEEAFSPALQHWLPSTPGGAAGAPDAPAEAAEPGEPEDPAEPAQLQFDPARSPYQQAIFSFEWHQGWLPGEPEPEAAAPVGRRAAAAPTPPRRQRRQAAEEGAASAEPPPRMESTGLMPSIPDPAGQHLRFDSSDEDGGVAAAPAPAHLPDALGLGDEAAVLVDADVDPPAGSPPRGGVLALEGEMQQLLVGSPSAAAAAAAADVDADAAPYTTRRHARGGRRVARQAPAEGAAPSRRAAIRLPPHLHKYWLQRYSLFSRFDQGVQLDQEGWFSATPEVIAWHHAKRVAAALGPGCVAVDAFAGAGGNAIQLAMTCARVVAVEVDPARLALLLANARVYGVEGRIEARCADFFEVAHTIKADVAFFSPPWGGPEYGRDAQFDPEGMGGDPRFGLTRLLGLAFGAMGCRAAAAWLPRNVALCALGAAAGGGACEVERALLNGRVKAVTAYYGELARDPRSRAAPARREGGGAGPAPEPGGGSEVDAQTEEPCAAGE